ncbi:hypothetical protein BY996DRAFT_6416873 [Phakopsora pachyrhizi]|uniref:Expressed protein n=1 Tax=Phakopsora pachyrhizi TaxID=170000 RepID=A0AAV0ARR5_PHAPC|nr:hypothetical protein BY996DRAFT_6416873 [Phakopsora pachyrhizi]CAH7670205.1 expressed protein [Phakopsora pachyrhizi]
MEDEITLKPDKRTSLRNKLNQKVYKPSNRKLSPNSRFTRKANAEKEIQESESGRQLVLKRKAITATKENPDIQPKMIVTRAAKLKLTKTGESPLKNLIKDEDEDDTQKEKQRVKTESKLPIVKAKTLSDKSNKQKGVIQTTDESRLTAVKSKKMMTNSLNSKKRSKIEVFDETGNSPAKEPDEALEELSDKNSSNNKNNNNLNNDNNISFLDHSADRIRPLSPKYHSRPYKIPTQQSLAPDVTFTLDRLKHDKALSNFSPIPKKRSKFHLVKEEKTESNCQPLDPFFSLTDSNTSSTTVTEKRTKQKKIMKRSKVSSDKEMGKLVRENHQPKSLGVGNSKQKTRKVEPKSLATVKNKKIKRSGNDEIESEESNDPKELSDASSDDPLKI